MSGQVSIACDNLHTFYDARVLKFLSPGIKDIFEKITRQEYKKTGDRPVFLNLAYNFFANNPPEPSYITGPFTLTYHRSKFYKKQIYIFGEAHGHLHTCEYYGEPADKTMRINDFLSEVFSTSSVFIDFYLEYPAYRDIEYAHAPENAMPNLIINEIDDLVQGCIHPNPPKCPWNTTRAHFTDIRRFEKDRDLSFLLKLNNYPHAWRLSKSELTDIKIIVNRYKKPGAFVDFFFEDAAKIPLLVKEMERSTLGAEQFREILYNFLTDKSIFIKYPHLDLKGIKEGVLFRASTVTVNTNGAQNIIMDFYQLSRVFKKFKVQPGDNQPEEPHHVISYSGDSHSKFLRSALKTLGFDWVKTAEVVRTYSQCADARGLAPLFPNF